MCLDLFRSASESQLQEIPFYATGGTAPRITGVTQLCAELEARFAGWSPPKAPLAESRRVNMYPFIRTKLDVQPLLWYCNTVIAMLVSEEFVEPLPPPPLRGGGKGAKVGKSRIPCPAYEDAQNDIDANDDKTTCVICMEKYPICIILPCAHKCVCCGCVEKEHVFCPLCKTEATQIIKVYE